MNRAEQAVAHARAARERAIAAGAAARGPERVDRAPDVDRIAAAVAREEPRDARVRRAALEAKQRRTEVRQAVDAAADRVLMLARGLANGTVDESDVVAAIGERDELRRLVEAWDLAVRELDSDPAIRERR